MAWFPLVGRLLGLVVGLLYPIPYLARVHGGLSTYFYCWSPTGLQVAPCQVPLVGSKPTTGRVRLNHWVVHCPPWGHTKDDTDGTDWGGVVGVVPWVLPWACLPPAVAMQQQQQKEKEKQPVPKKEKKGSPILGSHSQKKQKNSRVKQLGQPQKKEKK